MACCVAVSYLQHRSKYPNHCVCPGELIVVRRAQATRPAVDTIGFHDARGSFRHGIRRKVILLWAGTVASDVTVDQPRIDCLAVLTREFQFARSLGRKIVHESIGGLQQFAERRMALRLRQVDAHTLLTMAVGDECAARAAAYEASRGISGRRLYFDDLCA